MATSSILPKKIIEIESKFQHSSNNKIILYQIQGNFYGCLKYVNPTREIEPVTSDATFNQTNLDKMNQSSKKRVRFLMD